MSIRKALENPFAWLYGLLVLHWVLFVNYGTVDFYSFDWYVIHQWLTAAKLGLATLTVPYEVDLWSGVEPFHSLFGTRYFAMPFLIVSPQVLFLRLVSVQVFVTIQLVLAASVCFYSMILWKRHLGLSSFSAAALILMWSLNSALVARMGVGHIQLTGYFLIPAFVFGVKTLVDGLYRPRTRTDSVRCALLLSCLLFVVLLQGSVHTVYQMSLILGLVAIVFTRSFKYVCLALGVFALLAAYFILPNLLYGAYSLSLEGSADPRIIFGGYGTGFDETLRSITGIALPEASLSALTLGNVAVVLPVVFFEAAAHLILALVYPFSASFDGSWEYSVYVGPIGALLMFVGWHGFFSGDTAPGRRLLGRYRRETLVSSLVFILSLSVTSGLLWLLVHKSLGLSAIDRLPTRLLLYPLFVVLLCVSVGLDRARVRGGFLSKRWIRWGALFGLGSSLAMNSARWSFNSVSKISKIVEVTAREGKPPMVARILSVGDPNYVDTVNLGFTVTLLTLLGVVVAFRLLRRPTERRELGAPSGL
jgi:hypothetical protein